MGYKRPSFKIPKDVVERAIALRRERKTIREIAAELGWSKTAIHEALRGVAGLEPVPLAATPEDEAFANDLDQVIEDALVVTRGAIREIGKRLQEAQADPKRGKKRVTSSRDLGALKGLIVELRRLRETTVTREAVPPEMPAEEPEMTPEERTLLEALAEKAESLEESERDGLMRKVRESRERRGLEPPSRGLGA